MGKQWDASGVAYNVELWRECLRVLKPGGHLLAFGGTRTYHRMAVAIEDAGFEVRDSLHWVYGQGFPKSLDVSKAIDKAAGAEREVVGKTEATYGYQRDGERWDKDHFITAPATDAAKQWVGWGTALKPAHEPIVVARKPLEGTVAANVLAHGTGALNIDECRIGFTGGTRKPPSSKKSHTDSVGGYLNAKAGEPINAGRWPSNVLFTHDAGCDDVCAPGCPVAELDQQSDGASRFFTVTEWDLIADVVPIRYVAKPGKKERNAGLDALPVKRPDTRTETGMGTFDEKGVQPQRNHHPTVKPVALMRWLVTLVTPPGGTVLDPFLGSGTTAVAATLDGFNWVGCEMTTDYLPIIEGRVAWAESERAKQAAATQPAPTPKRRKKA